MLTDFGYADKLQLNRSCMNARLLAKIVSKVLTSTMVERLNAK